MRLYDMAWGPFPRRVTIYLAEKGIGSIERVPVALDAHDDPKFKAINPAATVPVLELGPGRAIRQSIPILEFLEEVFPKPNMIGRDAEARAHTRDLLAFITEAYVHYGVYIHHVTPLFANSVSQSAIIAESAKADYIRQLGYLEQIVSGGPFLAGEEISIADCAMFATAQFTTEFYGEELPSQFTRLRDWYGRFSQRPSAQLIDYPADLLQKSRPSPGLSG